MKKILALLIVGMLAFSVPAFAQARYGLTATAITADTASLLGAGTWVYGLSIYATTGAGTIGLFDVATIQAASNSNVKLEIGEATQYDTSVLMLPKPIYFSTAVTTITSAANIGLIFSGPEPTEN